MTVREIKLDVSLNHNISVGHDAKSVNTVLAPVAKLNCFVDLLLPCSVEIMGLCKKKTLCCHNRL